MTESKFLDLFETICLWWPKGDWAELNRSENQTKWCLTFKNVADFKYDSALTQIHLIHISGADFWLEMEDSDFEISMSGKEFTLIIEKE